MPDYHIYCIDDQNHIRSRHDYILDGDIAAMERAKQHCGDYEVEIWVGTRIVARMAKDGTVSHQPKDGPRTG